MPPTEPHGSTRATPRVLVLAAGLLLVARVAFGVIDATHPENRPELVQWTAPAAAPVTARQTGRLLLYAFTDRKAPASRKLTSEVFGTPDVAQQIDGRYVAVRIDGGPAKDTPETAALRGKFGVRSEPALVLANPDGTRFKRIDGYESRGALTEALSQAQLEVMDIPFNRMGRAGRGRSFRFQIGGHGVGSADSTEATGEADSVMRFR